MCVLYVDLGELVKGQPQGRLSQITPVWRRKGEHSSSPVWLYLIAKGDEGAVPLKLWHLLGSILQMGTTKRAFPVHNALHVSGAPTGMVRSNLVCCSQWTRQDVLTGFCRWFSGAKNEYAVISLLQGPCSIISFQFKTLKITADGK